MSDHHGTGDRALMGIGVADGERRAVRAAEEAIVCPLLKRPAFTGHGRYRQRHRRTR